MTTQIVKNRDGAINDDNWATPKWLYDTLDEAFHFDFDPYPLENDLSKWNGHTGKWGKSNFVNPPYNRFDKPKAIARAYCEWLAGNTCVLLIPAATGTKQFHKLLLPGAKCFSFKGWDNVNRPNFEKMILFMEGRIAFDGTLGNGEKSDGEKGKHDSMIIILTHV